MTTNLDVVVPSFNSGQHLRRCVESLLMSRTATLALRIVVVDNGSTDGSCDLLPHDESLRVLRNHDNLGFAAACNQGAALGDSPLILFLNSDTIVNTEALAVPMEFMCSSASASVGICGVQLLDEDGRISLSCSRYPTAGNVLNHALALDSVLPQVFKPRTMTDWDHRSTRIVDQVIGAFFLVRRDLFRTLGGFDERFFLYYEEVDFALRAKNLGWRSIFLSTARAVHIGGASSQQLGARRHFLRTRSLILFALKHFGRPQAMTVLLTALSLEPLTRVVFFTARGRLRSAYETFHATAMLWSEMPGILRRSGTTPKR